MTTNPCPHCQLPIHTVYAVVDGMEHQVSVEPELVRVIDNNSGLLRRGWEPQRKGVGIDVLTQEQQSLVLRYDRYPAFVLSKLPRVMLQHALRRGTDEADVLQAGFLGLVKAAKCFNPALGVPFSTYAFPCIRRHILHELRACLIRVPKRDKRRDRLKLDYETLDKRALCYVRFSDMDRANDKQFSHGKDSASWYAQTKFVDPSVRLDLADALASLPKRWTMVVRLRVEGYCFREIASRLGVSHQRVRHVYLRAIAELRKIFGVDQETAA